MLVRGLSRTNRGRISRRSFAPKQIRGYYRAAGRYLLSALGFDAFEYDGLTLPEGRRHWADLLERNVPTNRRKLAMLGFADARAYRQVKRDGARKRPPTGVWHLTERAPGWTGWMSTFMESRASFRGNDFRQPLRDLALDYEMTDPQELADVLPDAKATRGLHKRKPADGRRVGFRLTRTLRGVNHKS